MASLPINLPDICSECGAYLSESLRHCPTCRADAGAPNVRRCRTKKNIEALIVRFKSAQERATTNGFSKEFNEFENMVKEKSGVVVSMPAGVARKLFEDTNFLYANYEKLVGANARRPAVFDNDSHRCAVAGKIFGSYAKDIIYGVLSLTKEGLPTYGKIYCRLRSIAINKRTSFVYFRIFNNVLSRWG